ncbi:MAG: DUF4321 domain-containing protein [Armatimonadetes bacterium]|nr:DUF4321 domain-containing protein [Armatimonadota bacterium]
MKNNLRFVMVIAIGAVIGSVINRLLSGAGAPAWLINELPMGLEPPFSLDLVLVKLTFGFTLSMSFCSVLGMVIALIAFHKRL